MDKFFSGLLVTLGIFAFLTGFGGRLYDGPLDWRKPRVDKPSVEAGVDVTKRGPAVKTWLTLLPEGSGAVMTFPVGTYRVNDTTHCVRFVRLGKQHEEVWCGNLKIETTTTE